MKKIKIIALILALIMSLSALSSCFQQEKEPEVVDEAFVPANGVVLTVDFNNHLDNPLIKKVAMYNAGCINPISNYDRDFERITDLNADSLRIDLSIGKKEGTAGRYLVGPDYDWELLSNGKYRIDPSSLTYDFSQLDSIVQLMTDYDIRPYMSWDYIPYPLQTEGMWNDLDQDIENWMEVWEEIYYQYAKHYLDEGIKIGYHEIYNEPDLELLKEWGVFDETFNGFLDVGDFGQYNNMYVYGAKGILRADPDATIGGPAFALGDEGVSGWVGFLSKVKSTKSPLDFYSYHTYLDGSTWFKSEAARNRGDKNEHEKVVHALGNDVYFIKTAIHINEFSYLNESNGSVDGIVSPGNYYIGAIRTLKGLMETVDRSTVQWIHWAQFMEATYNYDPYGLIHEDGTIKAAYNALKIYMDMPVWRYDVSESKSGTGISTLVSSDDDKIAILIMNSNEPKNGTTDGARSVKVDLDNAFFNQGERRVYRIDSAHGSGFDNPETAELMAEGIKTVNTNGTVWTGTVPAGGIVYITINKDASDKDFNDHAERDAFADDIKTQYYYEDRYRDLDGARDDWNDYINNVTGSYSHYDRTCNTMYLGMGDSNGKDGKFVGQAHANGAIIFEQLPEQFTVQVKTEGQLKQLDKNSTLGMRVDYYDEATGTYTKSVYFYLDNYYRASRDPNKQDPKTESLPFYPWGTQKAPDVAVSMSGEMWSIDLAQYAPEGWNAETGRAQISFDMQNMGADTRAMFTLIK